MNKDLILTQAQAEAVYDAMCVLNNVCAKIDARFEDKRVFENADGTLLVMGGGQYESHINQASFAAAYDLEN